MQARPEHKILEKASKSVANGQASHAIHSSVHYTSIDLDSRHISMAPLTQA